jgi:DNA repair protein RadC
MTTSDPAPEEPQQKKRKPHKKKKPAQNNEYNLTIHDMPDEDRPREKLQKLGSGALTDSELLAILLRVGVQGESVVALSQRLLRDYGGLTGLSRVPFDQLCALRGMGEAKAAQLKAALEIGRRLLLAGPEERLIVKSPGDIANVLMMEMADLEQEHLKLILLNTKNQVTRMSTFYKGTVNSSQVRVAELFKEAIRHNATSIIMAHNHPSGDPTPSPEDIRITELAIDAGNLLEIQLLDHIVIGHQRWLSLRQRGMGFKVELHPN